MARFDSLRRRHDFDCTVCGHPADFVYQDTTFFCSGHALYGSEYLTHGWKARYRRKQDA